MRRADLGLPPLHHQPRAGWNSGRVAPRVPEVHLRGTRAGSVAVQLGAVTGGRDGRRDGRAVSDLRAFLGAQLGAAAAAAAMSSPRAPPRPSWRSPPSPPRRASRCTGLAARLARPTKTLCCSRARNTAPRASDLETFSHRPETRLKKKAFFSPRNELTRRASVDGNERRAPGLAERVYIGWMLRGLFKIYFNSYASIVYVPRTHSFLVRSSRKPETSGNGRPRAAP